MGMLLTVTNRQALKKRPIFHEEGTHVKGERGKGCGIRGVKGKGKESFMRISSNYEPFPLFSFPLGPSQIGEVFKKTDGEI